MKIGGLQGVGSGIRQAASPLVGSPASNLPLLPGQVLKGRVVGSQGDNLQLQFGKRLINAQSQVPLQAGQQIQVKVKGLLQGKLNLQLLRSESFKPLTQADISETFNRIKLPSTEANLKLGREMVKAGLSLNRENFSALQKSLAALPSSGPHDVQAAAFLKQNSQPLTPENISNLSVFLAANPEMGEQLLSLQGCLRQIAKESGNRKAHQMIKTLDSYLLNPLEMDPSQMQARLEKLARLLGAEAGDERLNRVLLGGNPGLTGQGEVFAETLGLLEGLKQNISAQRLINTGTPELNQGYYYLQVPLQLKGEARTMELRIKYYREENQKKVDLQDARLEFACEFENLGRQEVVLNIVKEKLSLQFTSPNRETADFLEQQSRELKDQLAKAGFDLKTAYFKVGSSPEETPEKEPERVDIQG